MEKLVTITSALPYQERPYQDRNGQTQLFASRGFIMTDGIDSFYAEMQGDLARAHRDTSFATNQLYRVQMQMQVREYRDREGNVRYSNEVRITRM